MVGKAEIVGLATLVRRESVARTYQHYGSLR
jgi:hypothetical protein